MPLVPTLGGGVHRQRQTDFWESKVSLVYLVSSRTPRIM